MNMMIRTIIAWIFILSGLLIGVVCIYSGVKKNLVENEKFSLLIFLKKGFCRTPFNDFSGPEIIAFGVLAIIAAILMYWLYFIVYYDF